MRVAVFTLLLLGCDGVIRSATGSPSSPASPTDPTLTPDPCGGAPVDVPSSLLVRMTGKQLLATERVLFRAPAFTAPFESGTTDIISQLELQKISDAAEAEVATGGHRADAPCDVTGAGSDACATGFITTFAARAFRRPLEPAELQWLKGVYTSTRAIPNLSPAITFAEAIDVVAQVIVQAPQHLYLSAQGVADATLPAGLYRMTGYERATRLAYQLTNAPPDDALLQAAAAGELDTTEGLKVQAARLLDTATGHELVRAFGSTYAGINASNVLPALENLPKNATRFPFDSPALRTAMRKETEALYERVFYGDGSFAKLMTSTDAYVNKSLGKLYAVAAAPADDATFAWVQLDGAQRAGLFTRAAFLAENANQDYESPIRRGVHVFKHTLCQAVPPPPPNVNNVPPAPTAASGMAQSVRQQTEERTSPAFCSSCHTNFNAIGFTLGNYDAMGAYQTAEAGADSSGTTFSVPVDSTATIPVSDLKGPVSGGPGLSLKLADSAQAQGCMAEQWFAAAMNRGPAAEDTCTVSGIAKRFEAGTDMHALVLDVVTSAPSLYVRHDP